MGILRTSYVGAVAPVFQPLLPDQVKELHLASLEILERVGVRFYDQEAVDLMKRAGCRVHDGNLIRIPSWLVERALFSAPKRIMICDRDGKRVMPVEGRNCFFGPGSDCLNIVDHRTGQRRQARLRDVEEGIRVCDALPNIDFVMSMFYPWDVDQRAADRYQMAVMLQNTRKPIVFVTETFEGCVDAIEMAEVVAGGAEALQEHPFVACYINVTTPLRHNQEGLQKLLFLSEKGLPFVYVPAVRRGITSPMTIAGSVALNNAGQLAGLVLSQLKREGAPIVLCAGGAVQIMDMRTMGTAYAAPDSRLFEAALPVFYDLPRWGLAGCSDSKAVDQQAAIEAALTLMVDVLNGCNIIHDVGYLEGGLSGSLGMLVVCDEIIGWLKRLMQPLEIDAETLALDLMEQIGPDRQFIDTDHTYRHFREDWYPELMDRRTFENWEAAGSKTLEERAREKVNEILESHEAPRLSGEIEQRIMAVVDRAAGRSGG
ncbi:MAG: trimethylamine methyltransferase family protein [Anaerolineae bacterium]|nr:trimethylamine methyltransferase family protein [Anaerolineae bacterium]